MTTNTKNNNLGLASALSITFGLMSLVAGLGLIAVMFFVIAVLIFIGA